MEDSASLGFFSAPGSLRGVFAPDPGFLGLPVGSSEGQGRVGPEVAATGRVRAALGCGEEQACVPGPALPLKSVTRPRRGTFRTKALVFVPGFVAA
ncbi:hypothetical protein H920_19697 [Fukomys damarensis]|uniref:Uncharacterized protein n=1 Tax=Fukomys damarensis TaxID=885580 RepID=A0A091D7T4_FUKDA|nr:hypothetical protein H920_19697 [Fukomys damarensis]